MPYLYLDLETRSELDVRRVGSYAYAAHPSTEILLGCYAVNDEPVETWWAGEPWPFDLLDVSEFTWVAHNIDFERNMLRAKEVANVPLEHWLDTAALAARQSLPRSLEELGEFFFPTDQSRWKDMAGNRVMQKLARPRKPSASDPSKWWTRESKPEDFAKLEAYCRRDVELMRDVHRRLLPLGQAEHRVWAMTERMNERGVKIDLDSIPPAQAFLDQHSRALAAEFRAIAGCPVKNYAKAAEALGLPNVRKSTVRKALRLPTLAPQQRRALVIHRQLARSSTAKLAALLRRVSGDGRLRGSLNYSGAERTGRWSSMGVQLQNLPRGLGEETELAFEALRAGVLDEVFTGMERPPPDKPLDPMGEVAEMLRGFLVGPFLVGDFSQIEARTLAWLAGQDDLLELFRRKADPYCAMASKIYNREVTKKDKAERFMGKQVVLGCGYGLGHRGFRNLLDETYDVAIEEPFAKKVINVYRKSNKKITAFWGLLERGFKFVVANKSKRVKVGPFFMGTLQVAEVPYAYVELPSGRRLFYARPYIKAGEIRYFGRDIRQGGMWTTISSYGGKLAENVTQAVSRDVLAEAMIRLEASGFDLLLTVHDEVVAEDGDIEKFKRVLEEVPRWAAGLPVEAECFKSNRYRK